MDASLIPFRAIDAFSSKMACFLYPTLV